MKSFAGERLAAARADARGFGGDRTHALFDRHKGAERQLTAREAPRVLAWAAEYPDAPDDSLDPQAPPPAVVTSPSGERFAWDDPGLAAAVAEDIGREVRLHRDLAGQQDLPETVLVTVERTREAIEEVLGRPLDIRRFRPNIHLELDAPPYAEEKWEGAQLEIEGGPQVELLEPCLRCVIPTRDVDTQEKWSKLLRWIERERDGMFGINAAVRAPGTVRDGAVVRVTR